MNYGQANNIMRESFIKEQAAMQQENYGGAKQSTRLGDEVNQQSYGLHRAFSIHEKALAELSEAIGMLTEGLAPITINRPAEEEKLGSGSLDAVVQSPATSTITSMTAKMRELTRRVRSQVGALDL